MHIPHTLTHVRTGTVIDLPDIHQTLLDYQQSRQYQSDKKGYINMPIGTVNNKLLAPSPVLYSWKYWWETN